MEQQPFDPSITVDELARRLQHINVAKQKSNFGRCLEEKEWGGKVVIISQVFPPLSKDTTGSYLNQ